MTAPPPQMPLFTSTHSPLFTQTTMAPMQELFEAPTVVGSAEGTPLKTSTVLPAKNEANPAPGDLLFITGTTLDEFKSKSTMTRIRKKAMGSYLQKEKKPRNSKKDQQDRRLVREASTGSRASAGSETQDSFTGHEVSPKRNSGNKRTGIGHVHSPTESPSGDTTTNEAAIKTCRIPRVSGEYILPTAPIVFPSRENLLLPYIAYNPGPFQSISKPLDPFATIYQTSHPQVSVGELKMLCSQWFGTRAMGRHWIPTVLKSPPAFLSTLCIASAHLDAIKDPSLESIQTIALRQEVMHMISQSLENPQSRTNDFNVIALTQLIASELIACQETALSHHENGLEAMIAERGGLESLGVNGRVACTASWVVLESAIVRETRPKPSYSTYANTHSHKIHPPTATIPESPIYCPKAEYTTVKRSASTTPLALDLLKDIRMMLDLFLHETKQSRHNSLSLKNIFKKITTQYPSVAELQLRNVLTPNDWKYEAIRITSIITATAIIHRISLSAAVAKAAETQTAFDTLVIPATDPTMSAPTTTTTTTTLAKRHDSPTTCSFSTSPTYTTAFSPDYQPRNSYTLAQTPPTMPPMSSPLSISPTTASSIPNSLSALYTPSHPPPKTLPPNHLTYPNPTLTLLSHLKYALNSSNLSECWADLGGVLLWIALTASAASHSPLQSTSTSTSTTTPHPISTSATADADATANSDIINKDALLLSMRKWLRALAMRVSIVLCFEHPEAVLCALVRMGEVLEGVGVGVGGEERERERERGSVAVVAGRGLGKRRRV